MSFAVWINHLACLSRFSQIVSIFFLRSVKALDADVTKLDDSYNKLTEVMAEGERDDYAGECLGSKIGSLTY